MKTEELVEGKCECCGNDELLQESGRQKMCELCLRVIIRECGYEITCPHESDADCNWELGEVLPNREPCDYCAPAQVEDENAGKIGDIVFQLAKKNPNWDCEFSGFSAYLTSTCGLYKIRVSNHELPPSYHRLNGSPSFEIHVGPAREGGYANAIFEDLAEENIKKLIELIQAEMDKFDRAGKGQR
jgi:hypothetical protein